MEIFAVIQNYNHRKWILVYIYIQVGFFKAVSTWHLVFFFNFVCTKLFFFPEFIISSIEQYNSKMSINWNAGANIKTHFASLLPQSLLKMTEITISYFQMKTIVDKLKIIQHASSAVLSVLFSVTTPYSGKRYMLTSLYIKDGKLICIGSSIVRDMEFL